MFGSLCDLDPKHASIRRCFEGHDMIVSCMLGTQSEIRSCFPNSCTSGGDKLADLGILNTQRFLQAGRCLESDASP
jgi:hypothetical protein